MVVDHLLNHCRIFPEGNFVALDGECVVGLGSGFFDVGASYERSI